MHEDLTQCDRVHSATRHRWEKKINGGGKAGRVKYSQMSE